MNDFASRHLQCPFGVQRHKPYNRARSASFGRIWSYEPSWQLYFSLSTPPMDFNHALPLTSGLPTPRRGQLGHTVCYSRKTYKIRGEIEVSRVSVRQYFPPALRISLRKNPAASKAKLALRADRYFSLRKKWCNVLTSMSSVNLINIK